MIELVTNTTMASSSTHLLVAAFDFGTTYSGYAFSFRDDPLKVQTNTAWNSGTEQLMSLKTPTCVLLEPNREFHSFGYEAENKYLSLAEDKKHHGWLLFRRFKMLLHNTEHLTRETTIEDINGVSLPAMTIIAMSIRYLKDHFTKAVNKKFIGVEENDIKYVLTVPAIWNDSAKQFMREAAEKAGIENSRLKLALEPEAASIWCQTVKIDAKSISKAGTQYMVVDLGGGTGDISVHEKQIDNSLKALHKPDGGSWGGNAVDNNFLEWLTKLFGKNTMERLRKEEMEDYFTLLRDFETKKRNIKVDTEGKITFRVSASLKEIYKDVERMPLNEKIAVLGLSEKITFTGDKLRVDASIIKEWFASPVNNVISHVKGILAKPEMQKVQTILLVGGFGESELVHDEMKRNIRNKRILIPTDAGLVVLKGAVRFGHTPDIVSARVMPFTYGIAIMEDFNKNKHPVSKIVTKNNERLVDNVFCIFVRVGEEVSIAQEIHRPTFTPNRLQSTSLQIYRSSIRDPAYVTDEECSQLGTLIIDHPEGDTFDDKMFNVTFLFGDTELLVKAKIVKTGREFSTYVDCLN